MIIGYLIVGMLLGMIAAGISLFLGSSFLLALAVYVGVCSISIFLLAAVQYVRPALVKNSFAKLKEWRSGPTRYGGQSNLFLSACAITVAVMFSL